ncbi:MAG: hypothetical protein V4511_04265 [Bacteroidota bacterium]
MEKAKTNNPNGRGMGNLNKLTKETKAELKSAFEPNLKDFGRDLKHLSPEQRVQALIKILSKLLNGSDEVTEQIRNDLFKQLLPEFKKIGSLFSHLSPEKRIKANLTILKLFTTDQQKQAITAINSNSVAKIIKDADTR